MLEDVRALWFQNKRLKQQVTATNRSLTVRKRESSDQQRSQKSLTAIKNRAQKHGLLPPLLETPKLNEKAKSKGISMIHSPLRKGKKGHNESEESLDRGRTTMKDPSDLQST